MIGIVDSAGQTQTGHVRRDNEDSYLMRGPLFMVADGMGGAAAGEIASTMCAEAFAEIDLIRPQRRHGAARRDRHARTAASTSGRPDDPGLAGMGTTVIGGAGRPRTGRSTFAHVGDSRAYLLRDGGLQRLSEDHSVVAELVARGPAHRGRGRQPSPAQRDHARAGRRAEGAGRHVLRSRRRRTTSLLLCTDGLTDMVRR